MVSMECSWGVGDNMNKNFSGENPSTMATSRHRLLREDDTKMVLSGRKKKKECEMRHIQKV
jgi:hypothetical protein